MPAPRSASGGAALRPGPFPLTLLLAGPQLLAFSDRFLLTVVAQPLKIDLDLSDAQLGLLQGSAFVVLHALSMPFLGRIADRGHRRALLAGSLALWSAAGVACALAGSFALLLVGRAFLGLGQASVAPAALSLLAYRMPPGRLGWGVSWLTAGSSLGRSLALLAGGGLLALLTAAGGLHVPGFGELAPWRALLLVAGLPNVLALAAILCIAEPPAGRAAGMGGVGRMRDGPGRDTRVWAWIWRRRAVYLTLMGASTCSVLVGQTLAAWAPTFYVRVHGLTPAQSGVRLGVLVLLAAPLGHLAGGRLLDRARAAGRRKAAARTLTAGLILAVPSTAAMTLATDLPISLAGFAALAAALGLTSPAALAGLQFFTPASMRGLVSALFIAAVMLVALGVGPALVGLLNDRVFGADGVGSAMLVVFTAVSLAGALLATSLGRAVRAPQRRTGLGGRSALPLSGP
jgi:MFS family permease